MKFDFEKKLLQAAVVLGCLVPLTAGGTGAAQGIALLGQGDVDLDSHFRYLSGLLFAIGIGFLSAVPRLEMQGPRIRLLTLIVFLGGLCRLAGILTAGWPHWPMQFGLAMELLVTPSLCLWQASLARRLPPAEA